MKKGEMGVGLTRGRYGSVCGREGETNKSAAFSGGVCSRFRVRRSSGDPSSLLLLQMSFALVRILALKKKKKKKKKGGWREEDYYSVSIKRGRYQRSLRNEMPQPPWAAADFFVSNLLIQKFPPTRSKIKPFPLNLTHVGLLWIAVACIFLVHLKDICRLLGLMGGNSSREDSRRRSIRSSSSSSYYSAGGRGYPQDQAPWMPPAYSPSEETRAVHQNYAPHREGYASPRQHEGYDLPYPVQSTSNLAHQPNPGRRLDRRYSRIADNYNSLEEVTEALANAGLESSNLIVGIDFTKSNEWTGKISFNRQSLHRIGDIQNPYEQAISIIGRTLSAFDEDNYIPCFGFGDASTHDQDVFSFYPDERPCNGFEEALSRYREIAPQLRLTGPTSFAPIIEMAMTIVEQSGGQYHVLLIIADGQVTRSVDTGAEQLSSQEQKTVDAIVKASQFPLSIILVGVGDGPWDMMKEFDDNIPARSFDNFQFVNFTEIMSKRVSQSRKETEFALAALMEIPSQYKATLELGILGHPSGRSPDRVPLPTPVGGYGMPSISSKPSRSTSFQPSPQLYPGYDTAPSSAPPAASPSYENHVCPICLTNPKDMAFGCGHQTCRDCGQTLQTCPICRSEIITRIKLY